MIHNNQVSRSTFFRELISRPNKALKMASNITDTLPLIKDDKEAMLEAIGQLQICLMAIAEQNEIDYNEALRIAFEKNK